MNTLQRMLSLAVITAMLAGCSGKIMTMRSGERIIFFGDSITEQGAKPNGYVSLVRDELTARYPNLGISVIGAGISGNKVTDLQRRLANDVIAKKPTVVVIYIGINDVWHWALKNLKGTTKEEFEAGLREVIARIQYAGAEVILCTPSVIGEKAEGLNPLDANLDEYAAISRKVALSLGVRLCDLRKDFVAYLALHNKENAEKGVLTVDGVHLNAEGNRFVASKLLNFLGGN